MAPTYPRTINTPDTDKQIVVWSPEEEKELLDRWKNGAPAEAKARPVYPMTATHPVTGEKKCVFSPEEQQAFESLVPVQARRRKA